MAESKEWLPLGDQALLCYGPDEATAFHLANAVRQHGKSWLVDVVQAYASVAVYFDLARADSCQAREQLAGLKMESRAMDLGRMHCVPVCYEMGLDLERVRGQTGLTTEQIIQLHLGQVYTVYAIGFCPGFPYLGYLPASLQGVPRLPSPRLKVQAGSVGLTGKQTGIYTEERPGGWNIVGRTPLELVNVADEYFPLHTGDRVQFQRIDEREFGTLRGERLAAKASEVA